MQSPGKTMFIESVQCQKSSKARKNFDQGHILMTWCWTKGHGAQEKGHGAAPCYFALDLTLVCNPKLHRYLER